MILHVRRLFLIVFVSFLLSGPIFAQKKVTASEAKDHVGETATVCGSVASARYAASTRGQPTFLDLDKPYPNQVFTIVIWGSNRAKFGAPEDEFKGKHICVTGEITEYRGKPEIVADKPKQIKTP
jgi:DNA/RNA endonuclease YhcR with UshA esterase domain